MEIRTDDEVYRVDAVWLGPPKVTMPWRARYVAWGVGALVFLGTLTVLRQWFPIGVLLLAWTLVLTVVITRAIGKRISVERPLLSVIRMVVHELLTPRQLTKVTGSGTGLRGVRVTPQLPGRARPPAPTTDTTTGPSSTPPADRRSSRVHTG